MTSSTKDLPALAFYPDRYSVDLDRKSLRREALWVARNLKMVMEHFKADSVAVTGQSGILVATGALMLVDFPLLIVRKGGEETHGSPVEGSPNHHHKNYIILDDFVATGATVANIRNRLEAYAVRNGCTLPTLKAVLCYNGHTDYGRTIHGVPIITKESFSTFKEEITK